MDNFVRDHWLADTLRLVRQEEEELRRAEAALGLPRALAPQHAAELRQQRDLLPGNLRTVLEQPGSSVEVLLERRSSKLGAEVGYGLQRDRGAL